MLECWLPPGTNCVIKAISLIELSGPRTVRRALEAAALPGEVAFPEGGGCTNSVWQRYLRDRGWTEYRRATEGAPLPPIPQTCLIAIPGHLFASIEGCWYWPEAIDELIEVESFWLPPTYFLVDRPPIFAEETKTDD